MATIFVKETEQLITDAALVEQYLATQEVIYEAWDISKLPAHLQENFALTDEDKNEILATFKDEIASISEKRGYLASDVVALSEATPNLETLLANFQREHHHTDDEVRFIVSGKGIFIIQGTEGFFEVRLDPGDLISVPPNVRHYFTLQENRKVVAIRLFVTTEGWVPIYESETVQ
ncbi:MAG: cupin domain-containing protein [Bacilli bacterium]